jgi:arginine utilization regulatory protein
MPEKEKDLAYFEWLTRLYDEILDNIHEGVIATDRAGQIIVYNKQLAEFEGLEKKNVLGRRLQDVYDLRFEDSKHKRVIETGEATREEAHRTIPQAGKGTVYLDEIHAMPVNLQAKLLRVLQEKSFRKIGGHKDIPLACKIVSSTNKEPMACVQAGSLRADLYYRLSVILLFVPPLRERPEDIGPLTEFFVKRYKGIYGKPSVSFRDDAKKLFQSYEWRGNVRELEHVIERIISMLDGEGVITRSDLPAYISEMAGHENDRRRAAPVRASGGRTLTDQLKESERNIILSALTDNACNVTRAAASLGLSRQALQHRMRKLGISPSNPAI